MIHETLTVSHLSGTNRGDSRRTFARIAGVNYELTSFRGGPIEVYDCDAYGNGIPKFLCYLSTWELTSAFRRAVEHAWCKRWPSKAARQALSGARFRAMPRLAQLMH